MPDQTAALYAIRPPNVNCRRIAQAWSDSQRRLLAFTQQFYNGLNTLPSAIGMQDVLTRAVRHVVTYLHGEHLGVSLATDSSGAVVSRQNFDPWGKARQQLNWTD